MKSPASEGYGLQPVRSSHLRIKTGCAIHRAHFARWAGSHTLTLLAVLFLCLSTPAQQPSTHDLAQRVDRHYNQLKSLKAEFTESYEGLGRTRTESGTLLLQKPGRMRWDYSRPAGKLFLLDGKYAWFYSKGDPQIQRIEAKKLDDLRSPLRFLLGHTQLEKEIDHLTAAPSANGNFTLTGIPHKQEQRIQRLALTVTADGVILGIEIQETDGAITRFAFSGEQPNAAIPPNTFRFTPPAGVPIVNAMGPV
ncbi:MAG: outer membrane lipoprotein chaperone LolA [Acidobacteria bacterium]|nr:outer membrane lipoprotein chaperone LolA [Acidobacteriota bacterium]